MTGGDKSSSSSCGKGVLPGDLRRLVKATQSCVLSHTKRRKFGKLAKKASRSTSVSLSCGRCSSLVIVIDSQARPSMYLVSIVCAYCRSFCEPTSLTLLYLRFERSS